MRKACFAPERQKRSSCSLSLLRCWIVQPSLSWKRRLHYTFSTKLTPFPDLTNLETVEKAYQLFGEGDIESLRQLMDD